MSNKYLIDDNIIVNFVCPPDSTHIELFDSEIRGFYCDCLRSGRKSYRLRYRVNGKLRVLTLGDAAFISSTQARAQALKLLAQVKQGIDPSLVKQEQVMGPTVENFFNDRYLPFVKSYKRSWGTDECMIRLHIIPKLGSLRMTSMSERDVAALIEHMKTKKYALGTCNRALVLLRYGYALGIRWREFGPECNPMHKYKNLIDDNKIENYLSHQQMQSLLMEVRKSENEMLYWIVLFLLYTGARKREVLDAKWADIDLEQRSWRIPKTKSGKVRHVPLSEGALEVITKVKEKYGIHGFTFIFANLDTGLPFINVFYSWNAARCRAGLDYLRIHDLRHSFASFLVNAGRSLYEVQELLGHADSRTTTRYAHLSRERLQEAVEVVPRVRLDVNNTTQQQELCF
jgi:integrase